MYKRMGDVQRLLEAFPEIIETTVDDIVKEVLALVSADANLQKVVFLDIEPV